MSRSRIYVVTDQDDVADKRLVRAISSAQAIKHCADHYSADVASQDELVRLLGEGGKVEDAGAGAEKLAALLESANA